MAVISQNGSIYIYLIPVDLCIVSRLKYVVAWRPIVMVSLWYLAVLSKERVHYGQDVN